MATYTSFRPSRTHRYTRRSVVKAGAGLAAAGALTGRGRLARAQEGGGPITIPEPVTQLPTDDVTFRWVDSGDAKAFFWREFFPLYQEAHPNITMDYQPLPWNEIQQVVPLGVRNGDAPDVFQIPLNIPGAQAAGEGWGAALDDVIPNFAEFKARFPENSFVPGITDFNGKTYILPLTSNKRHGSLVLYNRPYMQEAGFDPSATPFTWDQFREAARVLTEQGGGEYYGLIFEGNQVNRFSNFIVSLGRRAGRPCGGVIGETPFDFATGQFVLTDPVFVEATELLLAMRDDGSVFPGSLSLNAPEARAQMPQGVAAMIVQGPWNISQWRTEAPDFDFGVADTPHPQDDSATPYHHVGPGGSNPLWIFADSPYKEIAADIFSYMGTLEGQTAWAEIVGIADAPIFPEAQRAIGEDAEARKAIEIFDATVRDLPDARVRNPEAAQVFLEIVPPQPDLGSIVQGIYTGQIDDVAGAFQEHQDAVEAEFERAIAAAQEAGAQVSRDDFVFPNWNPTENYSALDYAAL